MQQSMARTGALCLALLATFCPHLVQAGHALGLSVHELVTRSDATVLGHTISQASYWQQGRIITRARVQVDELWAGAVRGAKFVDVLTLGGTVGAYGQRVDGAAELPTYGRVVLHLSQIDDAYTPTGMAEGVWNVDTLWGTHGRLSRLQALHADGEPAFAEPPRGAHMPKTLEALRRAVQEADRGR